MAKTNIEIAVAEREEPARIRGIPMGGIITFDVFANGEDIGQIDLEEVDHEAFISGVSAGERINNGCLAPAQLAVARFYMQERIDRGLPAVKIRDLDGDPLINGHNQQRLLWNRTHLAA